MRLFPSHAKSIGALSLILAAAAYADAPASAPAKPDEPIIVKRGDLALTVTAEGWIAPVDAVEVKFRPKAFGGAMKVESVVPHGATVKAGDPIFKLNTDEISRNIAGAENELTVAQANLVKAEADVRLGDQADELASKIQAEQVAAAEAAVQWWEKVDGPHQIKRGDLEIKQVADSVGDQNDELEQLRKMYKSEELNNATADIVVRRSLRQLERTKEFEQMAKERVEKLRATDYVESKQQVVNRLEQTNQAAAALQVAQGQARVARNSALFNAKQAYEAANRKLGDLRTDYSAMTVAAPADGVVYYGVLANGAWQNSSPDAISVDDKVNPEQPVITFVPNGKLKLIAAVPENQIGLLKAGDIVTASPRAYPEVQLKGKVAALPPTPSIAGEPAKYEVAIDVENLDGKLRPGHKVNVKIDVADVKNALLLPTAAVQGGKVKIKAGDKMESKEVITGRSDGEMIQIISGVEEGAQVVSEKKE